MNNKFKKIITIVIILILGVFIRWMIWIWMIQNPFLEKNDFLSRIEREQKLKNEEMEKKALQNFLNSSKADEIFGTEETEKDSNTQNNSNINTYWTWNKKLEILFSYYDNFWIKDKLIEYYSDLSTTDIEYILNTENQNAKEKFAKITVELLSYLKENRKYFNDTIVVEYDFLTWEAEIKRLYAREYYNYIKNINNSHDNQLIDEAKIELDKLKTITKEVNLRSKNYEISFNQFIFDDNLNYTKKAIDFKIEWEKILINYWE